MRSGACIADVPVYPLMVDHTVEIIGNVCEGKPDKEAEDDHPRPTQPLQG